MAGTPKRPRNEFQKTDKRRRVLELPELPQVSLLIGSVTVFPSISFRPARSSAVSATASTSPVGLPPSHPDAY